MKVSIGHIKAKPGRWPEQGEGYAEHIAHWFGQRMKGRYRVDGLFQTWSVLDGEEPKEARYKQVALVGGETVEVIGARFGNRDGIIFLCECENAPGRLGERVNLEVNIRLACDNLEKRFAEGIQTALDEVGDTDMKSLATALKAKVEEHKAEQAVEVQQQRAASTPTWGDW